MWVSAGRNSYARQHAGLLIAQLAGVQYTQAAGDKSPTRQRQSARRAIPVLKAMQNEIKRATGGTRQDGTAALLSQYTCTTRISSSLWALTAVC